MATQSGGKEEAEAKAAYRGLLSATVHGPVSLIFGGCPKADGTAEYRDVAIAKELSKDLAKLAANWQAKERKHLREGTLREYDCTPQPEGLAPVQFIDIRRDAHLKRSLAAIKPSSELRGCY